MNGRLSKRQSKKQPSNWITLSEAVTITGISAPTLRKFADQSKVRCYKTPTGHRMFDRECLQSMCQDTSSNTSCTDGNSTARRNYIYARVSSKHQMDDLARQVEFLRKHLKNYEDGNDFNVIQDIGSGINFKRKGLQTILESCLQGSIGRIVVAHRDRLSRFAFELIEFLVDRAGGEIIVCDHSNEGASPETELAEDLMSIVHVFSCRQMGKRRYAQREKGGSSFEDSNLPNGKSTESLD